MTKIAAVFGGSGFIGRYVTRRLAREGWRVRVAVRKPNEAIFVRPYGVPGQVEPVGVNIRIPESVKPAVRGCDAVVNCVGILTQFGPQKFATVHGDGARNVARAAAEAGADQFVHLSAIGADANSESLYARTKATGESHVQEEFPSAVILRPSVVFGVEDEFFNRFAEYARLSPVLPVVSARTRFQPIYVDDVARATVMAASGHAKPGIYELGGPDIEDFRTLMHRLLAVVRRRRPILNLPVFLARPVAGIADLVPIMTGGLIKNGLLTKDQIRQLKNDNVVSAGTRSLHDLGIEPTAMDQVLDSYLYRYRPAGQYTKIHESAETSGQDIHSA